MALEVQVDKKLVEHPNHYNKGDRKECWDEMVDIFGYDATVNFCGLSAYKYVYRAGIKEGNSRTQDLEKARVYINKVRELKDSTTDEFAISSADVILNFFSEMALSMWLGDEDESR